MGATEEGSLVYRASRCWPQCSVEKWIVGLIRPELTNTLSCSSGDDDRCASYAALAKVLSSLIGRTEGGCSDRNSKYSSREREVWLYLPWMIGPHWFWRWFMYEKTPVISRTCPDERFRL